MSLVTVIDSDANYTSTVAFASSTTSSTVDLLGQTLLGLITPSGLASTSFTVKTPTNYTSDGVPDSSTPTYVTLTDDEGTDVTITVSADDEHICFSAALIAKLRGVRYLLLEASSSETATVRLVTSVI